ncbi:ferrochelatase [Moritella sp. Urea-trap-13]|uniref:ferrochelatase n=1 Tax=Moritella sp. Urea-trap-13 TaxID=2058327 RepID=UPI000C3355CB|nr:ferrochelatase [Moritella sp. Urea-trap-13]PKH06963.1 ferrochelatase [Moritella sp. Urea-trap-13]
MCNMTKQSILLVNLGTPDSATPAGVKAFLRPFLSDPRVVSIPRLFWLPLLNGVILPLRCKRVAKAYQSIWFDDGSPLLHYSLLQQKALSAIFNDAGQDVQVELAMTYGERSINNAIAKLQQAGAEHIVVLPLFPQYSSTTTAPVFDQVANYLQATIDVPSVSLVKHYHNNAAYIEALALSVERHWADKGRAEKLLLSYHGIPKFLVEKGDIYADHCVETTALLCARLGLAEDEVVHCYQSRFGKAEWLQPYTNETLVKLAASGTKSLDLIAPAFAVDCLETLEEMAIENKAVFVDAGGEDYRFIACLNDDEAHVRALHAVASEYLR